MRAKKNCVCIISYTPILREPRVLRQAKYFSEKGYEVILIGIKDKDIDRPLYKTIGINFLDKPYSRSLFAKLLRFINRGRIYLLNIIGFALNQKYSLHYGNVCLEKEIKNYFFDVIICHDYITAPLGIQLKEPHQNSLLIIDCHEHFLSQNLSQSLIGNFVWYIKNGFFVKEFESKMLKRADFVTTVSEGISQALYNQYKLKAMPITVRSMGDYEAVAYRGVDTNKIKILYHGIVKPSRCLENLIHAALYLKDCYEINIRGYGSSEYINTLKNLALKIGVSQRINILEPVSLEKLVKEASNFDIGYFVWNGSHIQQQYVLPNKFFEYIMAGLVLCVSDLPEMAQIVRKYSLGLLVADSSPETIAQSLNSLSPENINAFKKNSLKAAKELNWELESKKLGFIDRYVKGQSNASGH